MGRDGAGFFAQGRHGEAEVFFKSLSLILRCVLDEHLHLLVVHINLYPVGAAFLLSEVQFLDALLNVSNKIIGIQIGYGILLGWLLGKSLHTINALVQKLFCALILRYFLGGALYVALSIKTARNGLIKYPLLSLLASLLEALSIVGSVILFGIDWTVRRAFILS